ncbi:hypothetical protein EU805_15360 [Salipiger sp. IMCC34102]|uniref:hypothetical protein n=1 Tax=Salipiger sp. IMCC34102 TaxID=2510647 RepID=UPI00101C987F|nr:hypothetical protein [Salipiger sp. IMCC34102]RYH01154.1 hypothetical protein EU805_15360 [Salipiger sp. IMCC34102]
MQWTPGSTVSAVGHTALVVWLIAGWGFASDPLPFEVSDVSIVTSEEYSALVSRTTPDPADAAPEAPVTPQVDASPEVPAEDPVAAPVEPPAPPPQPPAEAPPPDAPEALPVPPSDTPPELGPIQEEVVASPDISDSPDVIPRPSTRVAPDAVAPPPPDATPDPEVRQEATPEAQPDAPVVEEESPEQTAPEEAATQIVTEAEVPSGRVAEAPRPPARPNRPTPAPEPEPEPEQESEPEPEQESEPEPEPETQVVEEVAPDVDEDAIAAALAAAAAVEAPQPDAAPGPPMSASEQEGFRVAVNACWNVDPGSQAARVTMTVSFQLDRSGRVQGDVRQVGAMGGDAGATEIAYQAARRAILRCQGQGGYDLPEEKYDQWREVEITFDPSGMRLR